MPISILDKNVPLWPWGGEMTKSLRERARGL